MKKFNINYQIFVKLTDYGEYIYYRKNDELNAYLVKRGANPIHPYSLVKNKNGFTSFQLWDFMEIFGKYFKLGDNKNIIEGNNIFIDDERLEEVDIELFKED